MNELEVEGIELKHWLFKVRSTTNRRKWYDVILRKDASWWCNCKSFKYNAIECKHADIVKAIYE